MYQGHQPSLYNRKDLQPETNRRQVLLSYIAEAKGKIVRKTFATVPNSKRRVVIYNKWHEESPAPFTGSKNRRIKKGRLGSGLG